jgi:hypothetical protein
MEIKFEPPYETRGKGTPVSGTIATIEARFTNV